jgi:hypothetical protein
VRAAINAGAFNPDGKASVAGRDTFGELLDVFERDYVAKKRADGKLRSTSFDCYIAKFRSEFATDLGLREGEMLKVQIKHIDWAITLPPENAKGGATTDHAETYTR